MKCCGREVKNITRKINLLCIDFFTDRKIEIGICSVCGAQVAELSQYNKKSGQYDRIRPKKKHTAEFIRTFEKEPYLENIIEVEFGTFANMNWVHGVTTAKGQYAVDFNGTKTLIKDFTK